MILTNDKAFEVSISWLPIVIQVEMYVLDFSRYVSTCNGIYVNVYSIAAICAHLLVKAPMMLCMPTTLYIYECNQR